MIKFVILEDNKYQMEDITRLVMNYMLDTNYQFDILCYDKIEENIFTESKDSYDKFVFLLDYFLPNGTGIDVARRIREYNWDSPIVIFTGEREALAMDSFKQRLQILDFVIKDEEFQKNLLELFSICISQLNYSEKFYVKNSCRSYNFDYDRILYIYKCNNERRINVVTDYGIFTLTYTLERFNKYLTKNYVYTHKSCIVNIARVKEFNWKESKVVFDNGDEVYMLSRLRKKELMKIANR